MKKKILLKKYNFLKEKRFISAGSIGELIANDKKSFFNNVNIIDFFVENFYDLLDSCQQEMKYSLLKMLYQYDEFKTIIDNDIIYIMSTMSKYCLISLLNDNGFNCMEKINNDFNYFLDSMDFSIVSYLYINNYLELNDDNIRKYDKKIEENKLAFVNGFICGKYDVNNEDYDTLLEVVYKLISELASKSNVPLSSIKEIGSGSYSSVFLIGDKVLKIGRPRATYNIPNDKLLLQPLIRINLGDYSNIDGVIEVVNQVDTNVNLSFDEMYQIYKELRKRGLVFTDVRSSNFGRLLKDNTFNTDIPLNGDMTTRGITGSNDDVLKKGDIVVLDSDYIFTEEEYYDKNTKIKGNDNNKEYEKRYQEELAIEEATDEEINIKVSKSK